MKKTIVIQSAPDVITATWMKQCLISVQQWSEHNGYEYKLYGDEVFSLVEPELFKKLQYQTVIVSDLARLIALQDALKNEFDMVIWCDADFLIFDPENFKVPQVSYALGREIWIQESNKHAHTLTVHKKVHNAFMMYRTGNVFLDFYLDTAKRLVLNNVGLMSPQFIGPKLLTALHNIIQCPVLETAGMLSPLVIKDIANSQGEALNLFKSNSIQTIAAANLCNSLYQRNEITDKEMNRCIENLLVYKFQ